MWKATTGTREELLQKAEMIKFLFEQQTKETQTHKQRQIKNKSTVKIRRREEHN